jgi:hypothetical protein
MLFFPLFLVFLSRVFASEGDARSREEILLASHLYSFDKVSRDYARNVASHYDSPNIQAKVYQKSRLISLTSMLGKVFIVFKADRVPATKTILLEGSLFLPFLTKDANTRRTYYLSWYPKYFVEGEGAELIYSPPLSDFLLLKLDSLAEYQQYPIFNEYFKSKIVCRYPVRGVFFMSGEKIWLDFDANGKRILDPDWPLRQTVIFSVLEAMQVFGKDFTKNLDNLSPEDPIVHARFMYAVKVLSYAPRLHQFDLIDTSAPVVYVRYAEKVPGNATLPILPMYWTVPNCYLLAVMPAGVIAEANTPLIWALKVNFYKPFTVSRLTWTWFNENQNNLTPTGIYSMI